jgi:hypothetical protein
MKRGTKEQNKKDNNVAAIFYSHSFFFLPQKPFRQNADPLRLVSNIKALN